MSLDQYQRLQWPPAADVIKMVEPWKGRRKIYYTTKKVNITRICAEINPTYLVKRKDAEVNLYPPQVIHGGRSE